MPLFVVPMICELLIGQPISLCFQQKPQLAGLELADWADSDDRLEVDILIGADWYWDLVTGQVAKNRVSQQPFIPDLVGSCLVPYQQGPHTRV